jgi:hypothetical protein
MNPPTGDALFLRGEHHDAARTYARAGDSAQLRRASDYLSTLESYEAAGEYAFYLDDDHEIGRIARLNLNARNLEMARRLFAKTGNDEMVRFVEERTRG